MWQYVGDYHIAVLPELRDFSWLTIHSQNKTKTKQNTYRPHLEHSPGVLVKTMRSFHVLNEPERKKKT